MILVDIPSRVQHSYVDVQLLAATLLTPDGRLWTGDRRRAASAAGLGIAFDPGAPGQP